MKDVLYVSFLLFFCGCATGSFLNCLTDRMIRKESLFERSMCVSCKHVLGSIDMIPVFSYLFFKGRCRYCNEKIDPLCFYSELAGGILFLLLYCRFRLGWELFCYLTVACILLTIALYDAKSMLIPDVAMLLLFVTRVSCFFLLKEKAKLFMFRLSGSFLLSVFLYLFVFFSERLSGKEMMGRGDILLIFLLSSFMNISASLLALLLSCLIGVAYGVPVTKKQQCCFPFAPALCLAYLIMILCGDQILRVYLQLFQK